MIKCWLLAFSHSFLLLSTILSSCRKINLKFEQNLRPFKRRDIVWFSRFYLNLAAFESNTTFGWLNHTGSANQKIYHFQICKRLEKYKKKKNSEWLEIKDPGLCSTCMLDGSESASPGTVF